MGLMNLNLYSAAKIFVLKRANFCFLCAEVDKNVSVHVQSSAMLRHADTQHMVVTALYCMCCRQQTDWDRQVTHTHTHSVHHQHNIPASVKMSPYKVNFMNKCYVP